VGAVGDVLVRSGESNFKVGVNVSFVQRVVVHVAVVVGAARQAKGLIVGDEVIFIVFRGVGIVCLLSVRLMRTELATLELTSV